MTNSEARKRKEELETSNLRIVEYQCRDIGYGMESGVVIGTWDHTETNLGGAPAFNITERVWTEPAYREMTIYLFDDEVLSDEGHA
jgi:hypothetical protein